MGEQTTNDTAFERYVLPEIEVLLRVANSLTRNYAEAEDLVQDTLIRAYRGIDGFDGRHARAWLLTILRNTHINRNRRRRPELLRDPDAATDRMISAASEDRTDAMIDDEMDVEIVRALDSLDEPFRLRTGDTVQRVDALRTQLMTIDRWFAGVGALEPVLERVPDEDWGRKWREHYTAVEIGLACQRVMGAYGLSEGHDMERHVRDVLGMPIVGGSSNMQKNNIANRLGLAG